MITNHSHPERHDEGSKTRPASVIASRCSLSLVLKGEGWGEGLITRYDMKNAPSPQPFHLAISANDLSTGRGRCCLCYSRLACGTGHLIGITPIGCNGER
jgi:hypothetical protein